MSYSLNVTLQNAEGQIVLNTVDPLYLDIRKSLLYLNKLVKNNNYITG